MENLKRNTIKKVLGARARAENKILEVMVRKKDPGISQMVIEAGLVIVGVVLLVLFSNTASGIMTEFMNQCKAKALAIFN